jgi:hypothetical protein
MKNELKAIREKVAAKREELIAVSLEHHKDREYLQADAAGDQAVNLRNVLKHLDAAIACLD